MVWIRKNPRATNAYVDLAFGQRIKTKAETASASTVGRRAYFGSGRKSDAMIPITAARASPTNGCRGTLRNFIRDYSSLKMTLGNQ
jgi:hypothetical protein